MRTNVAKVIAPAIAFLSFSIFGIDIFKVLVGTLYVFLSC